jgi:hypothetical protein
MQLLNCIVLRIAVWCTVDWDLVFRGTLDMFYKLMTFRQVRCEYVFVNSQMI